MCLAALLAALCVAGCGHKTESERDEPPKLKFEDELHDALLAGSDSLVFADRSGVDTTWSQVLAFYEARHHKPAWSNGRSKPNRQGERLVEAIGQITSSGLDPRDYDYDELARLFELARRRDRVAQRLRPRALARFDVRATYSYLRAARHLRDGHVPAAKLDPDWMHGPSARSWPEHLEHALSRDSAATLMALEPRHEGYRRLRESLARYHTIADSGGWGEVAPGPPLTLGARGPRVAALVRRLAATGDLTATVSDTVYDHRLERAVGDLQARWGIPRSGVFGDATRAMLNVPVEKRVRQIELNLERWRWLPDDLGARHIEINIPAFRLELLRNGRSERAMRVVVGKRKSPTPVFSDHVVYLELNPTWTLPKSVVVKEIVPVLKKDRDYLAKNHMNVISIASAARDTVDPKHVPWKDAESDSFLYLVVQEAGPDNPLGRIKLMCPNEYDVYLHDTPMREKFGVATRDYSHGCVRVEEAVELADSLLGWVNGDAVRVDSLLAATTEMKRLRLKQGVPVHFLYWTAWADSAGRVAFRQDLYGLDQRLDEALSSHRWSAFELNPGVEVSPFWAAEQKRKDERVARVAALRAAAAKKQ